MSGKSLDIADEYAIRRLHITFAGDSALAGAWLPFAKAKVRDLLRRQHNFGSNQHGRYSPAPGVQITARVIGADRWVHIEATSGCTDRRGFLMARNDLAYVALYNDGLQETINPIDGSPRPEPDTAVRTKGYKVPQQLRQGIIDRTQAGKFSGLMRLVVGCYHAGGREAPFSYSHAVTHGIVKKDAVVNNKAVTLYWLVEISSAGGFAAPLTNTGKCCDSWDVGSYRPVPKPDPFNPATPISLATVFAQARPRVRLLLSASDMAPAYGAGDPWFSGSGWAFSASGAEAQQTLQTFVSSPANHYVCSRWKLSFALSGTDLVATLTAVEGNKIATLKRSSTVWSPISANTWTGAWGASTESPNPITTYPTQDAPIFVYYEGEQEVVLRWSLVRTSVAEDVLAFSIGNFINATPPVTCQEHFDLGWLEFVDGHDGHRFGAHTNISCGFYNADFSHVDSEFSKSSRYDTYRTKPREDGEPTEFNNFYSLEEPCWFIDGDPPTLKTACTSTIRTTKKSQKGIWVSRLTGTRTGGNTSSIVLFAEDREAVLAVRRHFTTEAGFYDSLIQDGGWISFDIREEKVDSGTCPYTTTTNHGVGSAPNNNSDENFPQTEVSTAEHAGEARLMLDNLVVTTPLTFSPSFEVNNFNLGTFLSWNATTKPHAESNVFAMHGNLHYAHADLTPADQRANAVYLLDNVNVAVGGFVNQPPSVAFVGRV